MKRSLQFQNFFWYLIPFIFKYLLPLLTLPIFTRFLSVDDFGLYALALFYGVFGSGVINLGLITVYERNFFELDLILRKNVLFTTLIFTVLNFLILVSLTYFFSDTIAKFIFRQHQLKEILPLALAFQTFKTFNQYFFIYLKNYENAQKYTFLAIVESILSIGIALFFVVELSMGIYGFIFGQFFGVFVVFLTTFCILFFPFSSRFEFGLLKSQLKLSLPLTPRIFFGVINTQFDRYMLGLLGTAGGVGLYDIGQKIASTTFSFMTTIQNVYSPQVYKRLFSKDVQERMSVGRYLTPFFYLSILVCLCVGVFSYEILYLLTPSEFHSATPIISILCLLYGFYFFGKQPQLLYAKKTGLISLLSFVSITLNIALNIPLIHYFGLMGAAFATTLAGVVSTAISFYFGQKHTPIAYEKKVYYILLFFVASIIIILILEELKVPYYLFLLSKIFISFAFILIGWSNRIITLKKIKDYISL